MSSNFDIDRQCLPISGVLTTLDNKHRQPYSIQFGHQYQVHNYCYNDHQMGNGITFDADSEKESKKRARKFLEKIPFDNQVVATHHHGGKGYYVLVKLPVYQHRPHISVLTLVFIGENGSVYQDYNANVLPSDEAVIAKFNKLVADAREAVERPIREAAEAARKREDMILSGAM
ncbi:MAG: hypothetical protein EON60_05850 [Alphaproteobacteria bacterium]|nr:MAG: hypothetical protein EON60_05850 [Alphaproteobacteria bacterium]